MASRQTTWTAVVGELQTNRVEELVKSTCIDWTARPDAPLVNVSHE